VANIIKAALFSSEDSSRRAVPKIMTLLNKWYIFPEQPYLERQHKMKSSDYGTRHLVYDRFWHNENKFFRYDIHN